MKSAYLKSYGTGTLTTNTDLVVGTSADDVINGFVGTNPISGNMQDTFQSVDTVSGGLGNDTINMSTQAGGTVGTTLDSVENINFTAYANQTFSMGNVSGAKVLTNDGSIANLTLTAVGNILDLGIKNVNAQITSVTYDAAAVAGLEDIQKLTLNNASNTAVFDMNSAAIETLAITAQGAASAVSLMDVDLITKLTVDGDQDLTAAFTTTAVAALATVDASAAKGNLTLDLATNVTASKMDVKTGSGNDKVTFTNLTKDDSFDMGTGNDTLVLSAFATIPTATTMKNVQNIVFAGQVAAASFNASGATELENVVITSTGGANLVTISKAAATAKTITFDALNGTAGALTYEDVSFALADATGKSDELTLHFQNTNVRGAHVKSTDDTQKTVAAVTATGIETININSVDMGANNSVAANDSGVVITTLTSDKLQTLNIVSDTLVTITNGLDNDVKVINAESAAGGVVLNLTNGADNGTTTHANTTLTINTGDGADTLSAIKADVATTVINTGAGKDSITLKAGDFGSGDTTNVDTITINAGAGDDTVDVSASTTLVTEGTITVTLGEGVDTIKIDGAQANQTGVTVTDFTVGAGGDKLALAASTAAQFANLTKVANMASGELVNGMNIYTGNDAASLSTTHMATAFANAGLIDANTIGDIGYIIASDGTDAGLYEFTDAAGSTAIAAGELVLLATLTGVEDASKLTADNFANFLA